MTGRELYEYFEREVDRDDYIDYLIEEESIDIDESAIEVYAEYLKQNNKGQIYEDIDELLEGYTPKEVLDSIDFGNFDMSDGYFRMNMYDCVESISESDLLWEMEDDEDFLRWYIDECEVIDEAEMEAILDEANKIAEEEEEKHDEEMWEL